MKSASFVLANLQKVRGALKVGVKCKSRLNSNILVVKFEKKHCLPGLHTRRPPQSTVGSEVSLISRTKANINMTVCLLQFKKQVGPMLRFKTLLVCFSGECYVIIQLSPVEVYLCEDLKQA